MWLLLAQWRYIIIIIVKGEDWRKKRCSTLRFFWSCFYFFEPQNYKWELHYTCIILNDNLKFLIRDYLHCWVKIRKKYNICFYHAYVQMREAEGCGSLFAGIFKQFNLPFTKIIFLLSIPHIFIFQLAVGRKWIVSVMPDWI